MNLEQIEIAIVDDHTLFRNGIAALLREFEELNIVFEAKNGGEMQERIKKTTIPQVVLMDINMPGIDGYAATSWLKSNYPQVKVLALSMLEEDKAVIKMIQCGAVGYILKESEARELLEAIKQVSKKGSYINEMVSGKLLKSMGDIHDDQTFSKREIDFLRLCCSELSYKEIADKMFVSPRTVDNYRESLFQKLNVKTRTGLVLYAIQNELFRFEKK